MAFGPDILVERPVHWHSSVDSPITLSAFNRSDLSQFPPIDSEQSASIRKYVTQDFIREARTFQDPEPGDNDYFNELKNDSEAIWWGIWVDDRLVGFTGYRAITINPDTELTSAKSRMVIMNADYLQQRIGRAAGLGRSMFAFEYDEIDVLTANVDTANERSYNLLRRLGSVCTRDIIVKAEDPVRHQMQLWRPDVPLTQRGILSEPLHSDSWTEADHRAVRMMLDAEQLVHI